MAFNNKVVVGDFENGNIYSFDLEDYSDNGQIQKWLRTWRALPPGQNNLKRTAQHSLQLDIQAGTGLNLGQGSDPEIMLRWSDDGGHTWSNEHWVKMGKIGEYYKRVIWRRLGITLKLRDRVYEVSGTDPVKIAIMGAELIVSPTNA
jgi:Neuraminidase (sialidase)